MGFFRVFLERGAVGKGAAALERCGVAGDYG